MNPIKLINVSHRIGERTILNDISVDFGFEKVTAVIGKSGSGKSTLLKTVNGLLRPTTGQVRIAGSPIDYARLNLLRKNIGYAVQGVGLFPHLTIEENVLLPARAYPGQNLNRHERLTELMDLVGLPAYQLKKYPYELSGGEQQRAGICRALFLNPPVLLMDEPFGSLDPLTRHDIHKEFIALQKKAPRTVLIVTHDMREAKKLADDILVIDNGAIQQYGAAREIFENPANSVVSELLMIAQS